MPEPRADFQPEELLEAGLLALIGYVCFAYYEVVGRVAPRWGFDLTPWLRTRLDDSFPFLPIFVLPYVLAYVLPLAVAAAVGWMGGLRAFRRVFLAYLGLLLVHFALYLAFPSSAEPVMRQGASLAHGTSGACVRFLYAAAPPWNAFPSFHVAAGWFFYRVLDRWAVRTARVYLAWFWLMAAGTAAIKIHWILDGVAGLLVAEAFYRFVFAPLEEAQACGWRWSSRARLVATHLGVLGALGAGLAVALSRIPAP